MIDKKYNTLISEVREISSDIARIDKDLENDRHNLQDFSVQMESLKGEVEQLRKEFNSVTSDVGIKVKDVLKPAIKEVHNLKKEMEKKKMVALKNMSLWSFIKLKNNSIAK